jgi:hypothetical protein
MVPHAIGAVARVSSGTAYPGTVRLAAGLIVLMAAAAIAAFVIAVRRDRDPVPDRVASCVQRHGGVIAHGPDALAGLRSDLLAGGRARPSIVRYRLGRDSGALLSAGGPALLVLAGKKGPSLGGDLMRRAYDHPETFALVATAPRAAPLDRCARGAGAG